ncbi:MAG: mannose-1-phosphate guanylyltransferase [Bacteroidetes bacterium]|nr:mannose-1-phosphate guanylyltransferase [Bacteroidota bacterium]
MAGGIGSRFWPASREERPKQFLDILGVGKSLIRLTFERFLKLCPADHIFIVTNKQYAGLVKEHLPELTDNQILTEPSRNNTAPCIAYTAFKLQALDPEANLVIAPSDHIILKEEAFIQALKTGLSFTAQQDALLTLGIAPTRPDTGYGYIEVGSRKSEVGGGPDFAEASSGEKSEVGSGVQKVKAFREKPDRATAEQYLASGNYYWNAGIFVWKVGSLLEAFEQHATEIHRILAAGAPHYNTAAEQDFIDEAYPTTPSISVDYAIMEKAENVYTLPSDFGWSDLGTWASLHAESPKDEQGNAVQGDRVQLFDTADSLVRVPKGKLVVLGGLEDYIVVDEGDVLLIWPKQREQEIKGIVNELQQKG